MLQREFPYQAVIATMSRMKRSTSTFPDLPMDEEWSRIQKIYDLLLPFDEILIIISGTQYSTMTKMRGKFKDY